MMQTIKRDLQKYNNITLPSATTIIATGVAVTTNDLIKTENTATSYQINNSSDLKTDISTDKSPTSVITGPPLQSSSNTHNGIFTSINPLSCNNNNNSNSVINNNNNNIIVNGNKRIKTEEWSAPSPTTISIPPSSAIMLPHTPSPGATSQSYTVVSNDFSSPVSNGSYDPYSPNIKSGHDDLSPQTSIINGYGTDSGENKKKKGPSSRQQEELCLVCGDRASGYHYNALTCEGCKGFFRRSVTKNAVYQCKYGNNCEIDMYMRRKCQECRLKKCLSVGMRPECVVPEVQCAVKRKEKKALKEKDKPNSTTNGSPDSNSIKNDLAEKLASLSETKPISPEQEELIHRLVYYQNEFEEPCQDDLKKIVDQNVNGEDPSDTKFRQITDITILTVQLIVEFAKRLPGFDKLLREDQIALLKACSSEVMMLRTARSYDAQTDSIVYADKKAHGRDSYSLAGMTDIIENLLKFCRAMYSLKVDNAEYALLTAIVIFSGRPSLIEEWKVEKIQEIYVEALKAYVDNRRKPKSTAIFAKLLSVLIELRSLGNENSEFCFQLKLENRKLPPFLAEIWDVDIRSS